MNDSQINLDIPIYSADALSSANEFHDCDCMIYVEGKDDEIFWEAVCKIAQIENVKIESVGGKPQLEDYITSIVEKNAAIIIACDADYSLLLKNIPEHPQIVRTYGYSIENTMYCPRSINQYVRKLTRTQKQYTKAIEKWIEQFCALCEELIIYDIANVNYKKGISIIGDSCIRFIESSQPNELSKNKIDEFISSIKEHFTGNEFKHCSDLLAKCPISIPLIIKGHFLSSGVVNWIKINVFNNKNISKDHLYAGIVDYCCSCTQNDCEQLKNMSDSLTEAYRITTENISNYSGRA